MIDIAADDGMYLATQMSAIQQGLNDKEKKRLAAIEAAKRRKLLKFASKFGFTVKDKADGNKANNKTNNKTIKTNVQTPPQPIISLPVDIIANAVVESQAKTSTNLTASQISNLLVELKSRNPDQNQNQKIGGSKKNIRKNRLRTRNKKTY
jgi:hypothetical protein